jgi:hypothetical protein
LGNKLLYIFSFFAALMFSSCNPRGNKYLPSLNETFSKNDKNPFGTYVAYRQMENMFSRNTIRDKRQSFDKTWNAISDTASMYVCIAPQLYLNEDEVRAMLGYVNAGNTLFISANYIDNGLLDEISCKENYLASDPMYLIDSFKNTSTSFKQTPYTYYYHSFRNSFYFKDSVFTKVLGVNEDNKPNFILFFHGKGKLILQCEPKAFSNYFLLKHENFQYLQNAFAYTGNYPDHLYWDDYYLKLSARRKSNSDNKGFSSLSEIMKYPSLKWAFWLSLIMLLLFILFNAKRRQRIVEKIKPNENTTVTFTETIGRLYLQKMDNKNIAEKMTTYFNEHVRNKYFLNTNLVNDDFITTLSRKSGVDKAVVESLYRTIQHAHESDTVDDYQLLSLNEQIQNFYKK